MIKKVKIFTFLFLFISFTCIAQDTVFKVRKKSYDVVIEPKYDYLIQNIKHPLKVVCSDTTVKIMLIMKGGDVVELEEGFLLTPKIDDEVILQLIDTLEGKDKLVKEIVYGVAKEPRLFRNGVMMSSMIVDKLDVSDLAGKLEIKTKYKEDVINLKLISFTFGGAFDGNYKEVRISGSELNELANGFIQNHPRANFFIERFKIELLPNYFADTNIFIEIKNRGLK